MMRLRQPPLLVRCILIAVTLTVAAPHANSARAQSGEGPYRLKTKQTTGSPSAKVKQKQLGPTHVAPTGDDAAYIAFDQGQYLTALRLATAAAKKGEPSANTLIGRIHAEGLGVPKNPALAAKWYARGAQLGDLEAIFAYGVLLATGSGVEKNLDKAAYLFESAAKRGHLEACYNLAQMFLSGKGKPENPMRAAVLLEYAAQNGILAAQYDLATLYQKGYGVEPNAYKAAYWMRQAAARGLPAARYDYAVMLLRGRGLNEDMPKTIDYLKSAAGYGLPGAQNRLANIYAFGVQVKKDLVEAAKWRLLARDGNVKDDKLDQMIAKLPAAARAKAISAAQAYRDSHAVTGPR